MNRFIIALLNFILLILGFLIIYADPASQAIITLGMVMISASIISFTIMIYFPPMQPEYVKMKVSVVPTETGFTVRKTKAKSKRRIKTKRKSKRASKR
jgi:hypothetical protein